MPRTSTGWVIFVIAVLVILVIVFRVEAIKKLVTGTTTPTPAPAS